MINFGIPGMSHTPTAISQEARMLKTIHLELARTPDHPNGDAGHRYEFRAPLDRSGHLDREDWKSLRQFCTVRHFENGEEAERGRLLALSGRKWAFSFRATHDQDEPVYRLGDHRIAPGEYLSITEHDGAQRTFRVVSVDDWHPNEAGRFW